MSIPAVKLPPSPVCIGSFPLDSSDTSEAKGIWTSQVKTLAQLALFYKLALESTQACINGRYSKFDAHTTANCCHGIAALSQSTLTIFLKNDLKKAEKHLTSCFEKIKNSKKPMENSEVQKAFRNLNIELTDLTSLYALNLVGKISKNTGRKTYPRQLKSFLKELPNLKVSNKFSDKITKELQRAFSSKVAKSYQTLQSANDSKINGVPLTIWGKYTSAPYLRSDKNQAVYAPCIFSMQVTLAHLMHTSVKVAFLSEMISSDNSVQGRYVRILQGLPSGRFKLLPEDEVSLFEPYDFYEPVIVFGGYTLSDTHSIKGFDAIIAPWLHKFEELCLACDVFYPQFPRVKNDSNFDSSPIVPEEAALKAIICRSSKTKGVSISDSSLFMLSHIYTTSLREVLKVRDSQDQTLPYSHLFSPSVFPIPSEKKS